MYKHIVFSFDYEGLLENRSDIDILGSVETDKKEDILYIGENVKDMKLAKDIGVDFGLALWKCDSIKHISAKYYFQTPEEISYFLNRDEKKWNKYPWMKWAIELQFIAQAGLTYSKDVFDLERFERIREISVEIMSVKTGAKTEFIKNVFCNETGFQTPKLDTRAAIFEEGKILLVKEKDNKWSLPGGWVDVNETIRSNTIKEVKEESGLDVFPKRIIAIQDRNMHNSPLFAYGVCKIFVLCEIVGGEFNKNIETVESKFFSLNELPDLSSDKNTKEQLELCFKANKNPNWKVIFD